MNKKIFLFSILIFIQITSLSTKTLKHYSQSQKQAYLNSLLQIQKQLKIDADELKKKINNIKSTVDQQSEDDQAIGETLEKGLKQQTQLFELMNQKIIIPADKRGSACKDLSNQQKQTIESQIQQKQIRLDQINVEIKSKGQCSVPFNLKSQAQFLNLYIDHLRQAKNICTHKQPEVYRIVNPNANYIYGDQSPEEYNNKVQQMKQQGYVVLQCPEQSPFPFEDVCANCGINQIYDVSKNMCLYCPQGYIYFKQNHECIKEAFNNNPSGLNYYGDVPKQDPDLKTCPQESPFFNGKNCIQCKLPQYFNYQTLTCKFCQDGFVFNLEANKCGYEQYNSNLGPLANYCCQEQQVEANQNFQTCPQYRPFFSGVECIQCDLPSYFSLSKKVCQFCEEGKGFSMKKKECVDAEFLQPVYKSKIDENIQNYFGAPHLIPDNYENIITCQDDKPYSNGQKCIKCQSPAYFNFLSNICQICLAGYNFDLQKRKCLIIPNKDQFNTNLVALQNYQGTIPQYNKDLKDCPDDKPYFDGDKCIQCILPNFVNFDSNSCESCPQEKQFNLLNRQCQVQIHSFYTDPQAPNIFFNGNFDDVIEQIEKRKEKSPKSQQCPDNQPFFNALENKCTNCEGQLLLFDFKYNKCRKCSGDSTFNQETHVCMSNGNVSPTIQRAIMNTFSWF